MRYHPLQHVSSSSPSQGLFRSRPPLFQRGGVYEIGCGPDYVDPLPCVSMAGAWRQTDIDPSGAAADPSGT